MHPRRFLKAVALVVWLWSSTFLSAQFYAPETEYHDPVQRVFVIEGARVLGGLAALHGTNFTEIKYNLTTKQDAATWEIQWLGTDGKVAKSTVVKYPTSILKAGPEFYRSVMKQMWQAGWTGLSPFEAKKARQEFWSGASRIGLSREENLVQAFKLAPEVKTQDWNWMPQLAGLLTHAALPAVADRLTIDPTLTARGAAWLALMEQASAAEFDDLWAPILFQAGRERAASLLWANTHPAKLDGGTPVENGWNIWLRKPVTKDVYLFATEPHNLPIALPMLVYDARINETGSVLADAIPDLVTKAQGQMLHNYAPFLATRTSISGGHLIGEQAPVWSQWAWLKLLSNYKRSVNDFESYTNELVAATNAFLKVQWSQRSDGDGSVRGVRSLGPLLRLAHKEGVGPLTPVLVVSARDLLNYGWEMFGLQAGARYSFVAFSWGIPDQGKQIFRAATDEVEGIMPFFKKDSEAKISNYQESQLRLQMVDGFYQRVGFSDPPYKQKGSELDATHLFLKRYWMRPRDFEWQVRHLWDVNAINEIPNVVDSIREEGGATAAIYVLRYFDSLNKESLAKVPKGAEMMKAVAETLPEPSQIYVRALYETKLAGLSSFERAQETEKLYWQNPDSGLENRVFRNYIVAQAYPSAQRFYRQCRTNLVDPVGFSHGMGPIAFMAGYLTGDDEMMKMALQDSESGSYSDMMMQIWDAAMRNDLKNEIKGTDELVERYESDSGPNSRARQLQKLLKNFSALTDAKNPDHDQALHTFGKDEDWLVLRWIWIEKLKLNKDDAVTLLGGRETGLFQQVLIKYLDKDVGGMLDALNKFLGSRGYIDERSVLANFLYYKLKGGMPKFHDVDLKPAGAISARELIRQKKM